MKGLALADKIGYKGFDDFMGSVFHRVFLVTRHFGWVYRPG
jgi:hypothetical protein